MPTIARVSSERDVRDASSSPPSHDDAPRNKASSSGKHRQQPQSSSSSSSGRPRHIRAVEGDSDRRRYHLIASNRRLRPPEDEGDGDEYLHLLLGGNPRRASLHYRGPTPANGSLPKKKPPRRNSWGASTELHETKLDLLRELSRSGGDASTSVFRDTLSQLNALYSLGEWDAREDPALSRSYHGDDGSSPPEGPVDACGPALEGTWLTLTRPSFPGCAGKNEYGEYVYTLGRMSFDMFRPTELVCSIQGTFNTVEVVREREKVLKGDLPKALRAEIKKGESILRTYNIITAFTIEPRSSRAVPAGGGGSSPNESVVRPIKGVMTTRGYTLPDPDDPHRLSVWFNGGTIEVNDDYDLEEWRRILGDANGGDDVAAKAGAAREKNKSSSSTSAGVRRRTMSGRVKVLAARMLMGASPPEDTGGMKGETGNVSYRLKRPMGGHGKTFVDVCYLDGNMRVMRGNMGSVFVFVRVPPGAG